MKARRSAQPSDGEADGRQPAGASGGAVKRQPSFRFTPEEVIARNRAQGHCDMCAGHVLALLALMVDRQWTMTELADHSHVRRSTLSEILSLTKCPCTDTRHKLAECFGMPLRIFELLAHFSFVEANSP